ncbi:hypothetical protein [Aromatoleum toluclasticum]|uniref:hypothetical protein n=1 Tax=Aromatoleum toluclasticum TaxID=92003 RepID=UPI000376B731|nr:hypothetical protein [Aromatoleum toluclasticum]
MFAAYESALVTLLADAIPGAPVFGSFDFIDFTAAGAPAVAVRVAWEGLAKRAQKDDALLGDQRFSVSVIVNQIRVSPTARDAAVTGIGTILSRLLGWRVDADKQPDIDPSAAPDEAAGLWVYTINLTISDTRLRAS